MGCLIHKWEGCKCQRCGAVRDKNHDWNYGCTCGKCGKVRDENHCWSIHDDRFPSNFNVYIERCTCYKCGKTRDKHHTWKCGVYEVCGKTDSLMGHQSGIRKLNGNNVETYCYLCKKLFKTESAAELFDSAIRRTRNAENAGCTDSEAESILEWFADQKK